jgi:hypothetical protein
MTTLTIAARIATAPVGGDARAIRSIAAPPVAPPPAAVLG